MIDGRRLIENNRAALNGKLKFGNETQVAALRFLNRAQEYAEHLLECDHCLRGGSCMKYLDVSGEIVAAARALEGMEKYWGSDGR